MKRGQLARENKIGRVSKAAFYPLELKLSASSLSSKYAACLLVRYDAVKLNFFPSPVSWIERVRKNTANPNNGLGQCCCMSCTYHNLGSERGEQN
jgi:hypothetical protein